MPNIKVEPWGAPLDYATQQRRIEQLLKEAERQQALSEAPESMDLGVFKSGPFSFPYKTSSPLSTLAKGLRSYTAEKKREEAEKKTQALATQQGDEARTWFAALRPRPGVNEEIVDETANMGEGGKALILSPAETPQAFQQRMAAQIQQGAVSPNPLIKGAAAPMYAALVERMKPQNVREGSTIASTPFPGGPMGADFTNPKPPRTTKVETAFNPATNQNELVTFSDNGSFSWTGIKATSNVKSSMPAVDPSDGRTKTMVIFNDGSTKFLDVEQGVSADTQARINFDLRRTGILSEYERGRLEQEAARINQKAAELGDAGIRVPVAPPISPPRLGLPAVAPGDGGTNPYQYQPGRSDFRSGLDFSFAGPRNPFSAQPASVPGFGPPPAGPAGLGTSPPAASGRAPVPQPSVVPTRAGAAPAGAPQPPADLGGYPTEKAWREAFIAQKAGLPGARRGYLDMMDLTGRMQDSIKELMADPALPYITGFRGLIKDLGADAQRVRSRHEQLKDNLAVLGIQMGRQAAGQSFGAMTVQEWPKFENYLGPISEKTTVADLIARYQKMDAALISYRKNYEQMFRDSHKLVLPPRRNIVRVQ